MPKFVSTINRDCRHAKKEVAKRKSQRTPMKTIQRVCSSKFTTSALSFAVTL
jgi:hypothetical protein